MLFRSSNGKGGALFKTGSYRDLSMKLIEYSRGLKNKNQINFAYNSLEKYDLEKNLNLYLKKINKLIC